MDILSYSADLFALRLPSRYQALAHSATDDIVWESCKSRRLASIPAAVELPAPTCRKRLITTAYRYLESSA